MRLWRLAPLSLALAACSPAGNVQAAALIERPLDQGHPSDERFRTLHYTASAGEANRVRISDVGDDVVISDRGADDIAVRAAGCTKLGLRRVRCGARDVAFLGIGLHGGDDRAFGASTLNASVFGGPGNDTISISGGFHLAGGSGNDRIFGSAAEDILEGGPGQDMLIGRGGDDSLDGGAGNDRLEAVDRGPRVGAIDCGPGLDALRTDSRDHGWRCELVTLLGG